MLKPSDSPIRILKLSAIFLIAVFLILKPSATASFRATIVDLLRSPLSAARFISTKTKLIVPFASYRQEIARLKEKIAHLESGAEKLIETREENRRLRETLDFKNEISFKVVTARVIARDPSNWAYSVVLDKGTDHGIRIGAAVFTAHGLAGKVVESGRSSSKALLITDPNFKVGAIIQKNREGGLLIGSPGGDCKMIYLSMDADVAIGDSVVTAGFGKDFPKGIKVGTVALVKKEPGRLYKYAIVKPSQNLSKVEEVLCVQ
ncbi:MAG: rod shape-determining protein MreC [Candidatus Omnitrophota bacterium]